MNEAMTLDNELETVTAASRPAMDEAAKDETSEKLIANMDYSDFVSLLLESRIL